MATIVREGKVAAPERAPERGLRLGWALGGLAAIALAGVVVAAVTVVSQGPGVGTIAERRTAPIYTEDELAVLRLVAQGVIPKETLDGEPFLTKRLVNRGILPREALEARMAPVAPLHCPEERALMAAVAAGVVPQQALETEELLIKRLANQGLIPRAAAAPCR